MKKCDIIISANDFEFRRLLHCMIPPYAGMSPFNDTYLNLE